MVDPDEHKIDDIADDKASSDDERNRSDQSQQHLSTPADLPTQETNSPIPTD